MSEPTADYAQVALTHHCRLSIETLHPRFGHVDPLGFTVIEMHETAENFFVNGERINSPYHGNGWDPYALWPEGDPVERAKAPGED